MRVVALISGGKDSCYNMLQCVAAGHEICALANLRPESKDELDSYMYQTVGHQGVELYAEAMGLPLFRQPTLGVAVQHEKLYVPTPEDEVEDLYQLLSKVKDEINIEAVAVGAVLSDYQRIRVENVCSRLGLVALAYLWRRDQAVLLQEMIDCNVDAIIIKVASLGLDPAKHLGLRISQIQPHLIKMNEKYGLNICGEGGEYETFTLDCPLFTKSVVIDDYETVIHSNDAVAPVGYINFRKMHLEDKEIDETATFIERLQGYPVKTALDFIVDIDELEITDCVASSAQTDGDDDNNSGTQDKNNGDKNNTEECSLEKQLVMWEEDPIPDNVTVCAHSSGWCWFGGIVGQSECSAEATKEALNKLSALVQSQEYELSDLVSISLYVRDMSSYASINSEYQAVLNHANPPVRVCVEVPVSTQTPVLLQAVAYKQNEASAYRKHTMHVQGISHWAPANIGPYSQAVRVGDVIYIAGQIALVPGTMTLVAGSVRRQCRLALRHVDRLIKAMDANTQLRDVVQGVCYVTNAAYISEARREWERRTNNAIMDYVVVPQLPRQALIEWQIWAHRGNTRFEYEETGCVVGDNRVSIRRRWNYDNTVAAIVCYVSTGSSTSNPQVCDDGCKVETLSESQLEEVFVYALGRLIRGDPPPNNPVCSLQVLYRVGRAPTQETLHSVLGKLQDFNIVPTVLPVCQLNHPNTFLSLCAVRHE